MEAESDDDGEEIEDVEVPKSTTRTKRAVASRFAFDISRLLQALLSYLIAIRRRTRGLLRIVR